MGVCVLSAWCVCAGADETAEKGREVFKANHQAVVTVRATLSLSMGGEEQENVSQCTATVIDPSGLAVLSLTMVDPSSYLQGIEGAPEVQSKVVSLKMILSDGAELPAEVVLRDQVLDLVFVRPVVKPAQAMPFVRLDSDSQPELLDQLVIILQLGQVARRAHSACVARVETVVEKPRRFYTIGMDRSMDMLCSPAFTLDGKFVGIGVMRSVEGSEEESEDNTIVIIVPAGDIREAVKQVPPYGPPPAGDKAAAGQG